MIIIIHRVNSIEALKKVPKEYGVEVDVRAYENRLVLSHEPFAKGDYLEDYLQVYDHKFIVFNIKETGIEQQVIDTAKSFGIEDYFLLDVEYPFIYKYAWLGRFSKIAVRFSEHEPLEYALANRFLEWVWIDTFSQLPLDIGAYDSLKNAGFNLCLVSPDQFGRSEDIPVYIKYMKKRGIRVNAVMTELENAKLWEVW